MPILVLQIALGIVIYYNIQTAIWVVALVDIVILAVFLPLFLNAFGGYVLINAKKEGLEIKTNAVFKPKLKQIPWGDIVEIDFEVYTVSSSSKGPVGRKGRRDSHALIHLKLNTQKEPYTFQAGWGHEDIREVKKWLVDCRDTLRT